MIELVFYIWLLGATLVFVGVTLTGESSERFEPIWLLVLATSWPFMLLFMLVGVVLVAISAASRTDR
jgi:hypothetical protein